VPDSYSTNLPHSFRKVSLFIQGLTLNRIKLPKTLQQVLGPVMTGSDSLDRPRVCIVGAGIAGLRAAGLLIEQG
jgi:NADPH-dependent 2,4-dienoyl-CoA reductase/sulfur reductase-like enzyme